MKKNRHCLIITFLGLFLALLWMFAGEATFSNSIQAKIRTASDAVSGEGLSITTPQLNDAFVGVSYDLLLAATGCSGSCLWEITAGRPAWLELDSATGALSGMPGPGDVRYGTVLISVRDESGKVAVKDFILRVTEPLAFVNTPLPEGFKDQEYSERIPIEGGNAPIQFTLPADGLPPDLKCDNQTGVIYGTPNSTGQFIIKVDVSDDSFPDVQKQSKAISLIITTADTLTIMTSGEFPQATMGKKMGALKLEAIGGMEPLAWSISQGFLPQGLVLDQITGEISGKPNDKGDFFFTVQVDDNDTKSAQKEFHLNVAGALDIVNAPPEFIAQGVDFGFVFMTSGGTPPFKWSRPEGKLPKGVKLNAQTGTLFGTPSELETAEFAIKVTDSSATPQVKKLNCKITVTSDLIITTQSLPDGKVNEDYPASTISWNPGKPPYGFVINEIDNKTMPNWLKYKDGPGPESVTLYGTPDTNGTFEFIAKVTDSGNQSAEKAFSIMVPGDLKVGTELNPAMVGMPYHSVIGVEGGKKPYSWQIILGELPLGLRLNSTTGLISGNLAPDATTSSFEVRVTDSASSLKVQKLKIEILFPVVITTPNNLPTGEEGVYYEQTIEATGGDGNYTWDKITDGPSWLTQSSKGNKLIVRGTPSAPDTFSFTARVVDGKSNSAKKKFYIPVVKHVEVVLKPLLTGEVGMLYEQSIYAREGLKDYTWTIKNSSLPLELEPKQVGNKVIISGTPLKSSPPGNPFKFTAEVADSLGALDKEEFQVEVVEHVTIITKESLPDGYQGVEYNATIEGEGGDGNYTWTIKHSTLPPELKPRQEGNKVIISGTPAKGSPPGTPFKFTAEVTDSLKPVPATDSKEFTIVVVPRVHITTPKKLPPGEVGMYYEQTIYAKDGIKDYTWTVKDNHLPDQFTLRQEGNNYIVSGTPNGSGKFTFTAVVTDSLTPDPSWDSKEFSIEVVEHVQIRTESPLPPGKSTCTTSKPYMQRMVLKTTRGPLKTAICRTGLRSGRRATSSLFPELRAKAASLVFLTDSRS